MVPGMALDLLPTCLTEAMHSQGDSNAFHDLQSLRLLQLLTFKMEQMTFDAFLWYLSSQIGVRVVHSYP